MEMTKNLVKFVKQRGRQRKPAQDKNDTQGSANPWISPTAVLPPAPLMGAVEPTVEVFNGEFVYAPLAISSQIGAFRLLRIMPGQGDQQLQCSILHTTLRSAANTYEALSHTWGEATNNEDILIGDNGGKLSITASCASAIRYLRYFDRPTLIWVDAICINQKDISERNHPLALMGFIYKFSNQVTIFLGEQSEDSDLIMDYLSVFSIERHKHNPWSSNARIDLGHEERHALRNLLNRPWFTRVWILQEVFMADIEQTVMVCGDRWVDWLTVRCFKTRIEAGEKEDFRSIYDSITLPFSWPYVLSLHERSSHSVHKDLGNILHSTRHFGATDPRDRFFALLNLFEDAKAEGLVADYGLTTAQAYEALARFLIQHDLGILSSVQGFSDLEGLPSWACDWSQKLKVQPLYPGTGSFTAGGTGCKTISSFAEATSQGDHALVLHGLLIGEVVPDIWWDNWVPNTAHNLDDFSFQSTIEVWDAVARHFRSSTAQPSVGNHIEDEIGAAVRDQYPILHAMTRAFSHPVWDGHTRAVAFSKVSEMFKIGGTQLSDATTSPTEQVSQSSLKAADPFVSKFPIACGLSKLRTARFFMNKELVSWRKCTTAALQGRVFLGTKNGYYGLAPAHIKEKDIICVFPGAPVPYALRPVGDKFRLVGECFVQGIMYGETLKDFGQSDSNSKNDSHSQFESRSFTLV